MNLYKLEKFFKKYGVSINHIGKTFLNPVDPTYFYKKVHQVKGNYFKPDELITLRNVLIEMIKDLEDVIGEDGLKEAESEIVL